MRVLTLIVILSIVNAYILLNNVECVIPKIITPCEDISLHLLQTSQEVAKYGSWPGPHYVATST